MYRSCEQNTTGRHHCIRSQFPFSGPMLKWNCTISAQLNGNSFADRRQYHGNFESLAAL